MSRRDSRRDWILRVKLFQRVVAEEQNLETERDDDVEGNEENDDEPHRFRVSLQAAHVSHLTQRRRKKRYAHRSKNRVHVRDQKPPRDEERDARKDPTCKWERVDIEELVPHT